MNIHVAKKNTFMYSHAKPNNFSFPQSLNNNNNEILTLDIFSDKSIAITRLPIMLIMLISRGLCLADQYTLEPST